MKTRRNMLTVVMVMAAIGLMAGAAQAAEWNLNNSGNWNDSGNWVNPATFPNGIDATADLSKLNITGHRTISLQIPITVGTLVIGDTNGSHNYTIQNGTGGPLTFDVSSGNATLTQTATSRENTITADIVLNDTLEITNNSTYRLNLRPISGAGGLTLHSGYLSVRDGANTYTGTTTLNSGTILVYDGSGKLAPGNFTINTGVYEDYWGGNFNRGLGTGDGQFQITGGVSGFSGQGRNGFNVRINNNDNYEVVWGSTYFNPSTLVLQAQTANKNGKLTFRNKLDLNGADRTIVVQKDHAEEGLNGYAQMINVIGNSTGTAGIIKTGPGNLFFNAANTYNGNTQILEGLLKLNSGGSINNSPVIAVASGATFDVSAKGGFVIGSGQTLTGGGTVVGEVIAGTGAVLAPGSSPGTTTYTGNQTWNGGASYEWEIQDWTGTAGDATGWDMLDITDAATDPDLTITATALDPFIIEIMEFSTTNFGNDAKTFEILQADGGITGFDASFFTLDTAGWTLGGDWAIEQAGNSLNLNFTPGGGAIPEPMTMCALGMAIAGLGGYIRKRKRS